MKILGVKVSNRTGDESDFVNFDISEVNYINLGRVHKKSDPVPFYHTETGVYVPLLTLKDISISLKSKGFGYVDKSTIINKEKIYKRSKNEFGITIQFKDKSTLNVSSRSKYYDFKHGFL